MKSIIVQELAIKKLEKGIKAELAKKSPNREKVSTWLILKNQLWKESLKGE